VCIHICGKQLVVHTSLIYSSSLNDGEVISQWRALWVGIESYLYQRVRNTFLEECFLRNSRLLRGTRNSITMFTVLCHWSRSEPHESILHPSTWFFKIYSYLNISFSFTPTFLRVFLFQTFPQNSIWIFLPSNACSMIRSPTSWRETHPRIFDTNTNYESPCYAVFSIFILTSSLMDPNSFLSSLLS